MARANTKLAKLERSLANARRRARTRKSDPLQEAAFSAAGGAGVALMADNNIKLPIPGIPNSLQVALTALLVNKFAKPTGLAKDMVTGVQNAGASLYGYGLAKKFKDPQYTIEGSDYIGSEHYDTLSGEMDSDDHLQEG